MSSSTRKFDQEVMNLNNVHQRENAKRPYSIIQCLQSLNGFLIKNRVFFFSSSLSGLVCSVWFGGVVKFLFYSWCLFELFRGELSVSCLDFGPSDSPLVMGIMGRVL